eukprot:403344884
MLRITHVHPAATTTNYTHKSFSNQLSSQHNRYDSTGRIRKPEANLDLNPNQDEDNLQGNTTSYNKKPQTAKSNNQKRTLMKQLIREEDHQNQGQSHYNLIKNMEEKDIRNLSRVIENSIVSQMRRGSGLLNRNRHHTFKNNEDITPSSNAQNNQDLMEKSKKHADQYVNHIRYGISSIDTNIELKKFIVKQTEKKQNCKNRLQNDIKIFMDDLIKVKESKQTSSTLGTGGVQRQKTMQRFVRKQDENLNFTNLQEYQTQHRTKTASSQSLRDKMKRLRQQQVDLINRVQMTQGNQSGIIDQNFSRQQILNSQLNSSHIASEIQSPHQASNDVQNINTHQLLQLQQRQMTQIIMNNTSGSQALNLSLPDAHQIPLHSYQTNINLLQQRKNQMPITRGLSKKQPVDRSSQLLKIINQCDNFQKKSSSLVTKVSRENLRFKRMKGLVQRNLDRNLGDKNSVAEDNELMQILANYRV